MTECIAYSEYAKLKYNAIITMKICVSLSLRENSCNSVVVAELV